MLRGTAGLVGRTDGMTEVEPAATPITMIPRTVTTMAAVAPVVVVQFPDLWGRNVSPFGLKLEAWLRLADIPYTVEPTASLGKAPKGKLPYIRDEGRLIGDTTLIIEHLKSTRGIDPDAGLTEREYAEALMLQRMLEEHFYFALVYSRWIDEAGWAVLQPAFFGHVPFPVRQVAATYVRRRIRRMLHLQGMGRHRPSEIYAMARNDLQALADYGAALGLAFQVVDDILDVTQDSATLGKTAGKDAEQGKPTYVSLLGLERAQAYARELLVQALAALDAAALPDTRALAALAQMVVNRSH